MVRKDFLLDTLILSIIVLMGVMLSPLINAIFETVISMVSTFTASYNL